MGFSSGKLIQAKTSKQDKRLAVLIQEADGESALTESNIKLTD
jgi:hypothetical protein